MGRRQNFDDDDGEILEELSEAEPLDGSASNRAISSGPPRRDPPSVVFEDPTLLIVDKPAWLSIQPESDDSGLFETLDLPPPAGLVFPVDDRASGLTMIARQVRFISELQRQIAAGRAAVTFLAIVHATLPGAFGAIELPLRVPRQPWAGVRVDLEKGQPARTEWRRLEAFAGHALLDCVPRPVLRNQVRAHLQAAGMPLAVDPAYGGGRELMLSSFKSGYRPSRRRAEKPLLARLSLHVARIDFDHPESGSRLSLSAAPPRDFRAAVQQLAKYGRLPSNGAVRR